MYDSNIQELKKSLSMTNEGIKHNKSEFVALLNNDLNFFHLLQTKGM